MNIQLIANSILVICLSALSVSVTLADTPTDDQLLELEQQIKQQEVEQEQAKQRAAEDARRSAEAQKLKEERARLEEERRKLEEQKQAVLEKLKQEEEQHAAEKTEKVNEEKLNLLIDNARNAESNKDYDLAIKKYNDVLKEYPNNTEATSSIKRIQSILKICQSIIGVWKWNNGAKTRFYEDGSVKSTAFIIKSEGSWKCVDPGKRIFTFNTWDKERKVIISEDYTKIESIDAILGTKITADKLSNDPFEKVVPVKNKGTAIP